MPPGGGWLALVDGVAGYAALHDLLQRAGTVARLLAWEGARKRAIHLRLSRIARAKPLRAAAIPEPELLERAATYQIGGWTTTEAPFEVKVKVEYVFQDRNEVQWMYLEKSGNSWRIARVDTAERIQTLVPYGTPVR